MVASGFSLPRIVLLLAWVVIFSLACFMGKSDTSRIRCWRLGWIALVFVDKVVGQNEFVRVIIIPFEVNDFSRSSESLPQQERAHSDGWTWLRCIVWMLPAWQHTAGLRWERCSFQHWSACRGCRWWPDHGVGHYRQWWHWRDFETSGGTRDWTCWLALDYKGWPSIDKEPEEETSGLQIGKYILILTYGTPVSLLLELALQQISTLRPMTSE